MKASPQKFSGEKLKYTSKRLLNYRLMLKYAQNTEYDKEKIYGINHKGTTKIKFVAAKHRGELTLYHKTWSVNLQKTKRKRIKQVKK